MKISLLWIYYQRISGPVHHLSSLHQHQLKMLTMMMMVMMRVQMVVMAMTLTKYIIWLLFWTDFASFVKNPSSETQGRSVGPGEKARQKFSSTGGKATGYRLSPDHFQTVKRMLAPDWAQKMLCIIVPNRRTASPEFFSRVRTRRLLTRSRLVWLMHQRNARSQESFSLI